jgi:TetR/AcrR family transcriptional regulator
MSETGQSGGGARRSKPTARRTRGDGGRRERLLETATREFAAKGLAGARVDAIARAARSNKQLVYYYFGNKLGLYNEVIGRIGPMAHDELYPAAGRDVPMRLVDRVRRRVTHRFGSAAARWVRLNGWEALERGDKDILRYEERYDAWRHRMREIEEAQARGEVDARFDAEMLALALFAVEMMPRTLPQLTKILTGLSYRDEEFVARHEQLLVELVEHLRARQ